MRFRTVARACPAACLLLHVTEMTGCCLVPATTWRAQRGGARRTMKEHPRGKAACSGNAMGNASCARETVRKGKRRKVPGQLLLRSEMECFCNSSYSRARKAGKRDGRGYLAPAAPDEFHEVGGLHAVHGHLTRGTERGTPRWRSRTAPFHGRRTGVRRRSEDMAPEDFLNTNTLVDLKQSALSPW